MPDRPRPDRHGRQGQVMDLVSQAAYVRVGDLSRALDVSEVTVRADLRQLEAAGQIQRVWGGARPAATPSAPGPRSVSSVTAVATMAVALVRPGDTIVLAAGAASAAVGAALGMRPDLSGVTVVTSDPTVCEVLSDHLDRIDVRVSGGIYDGTVLAPNEDALGELGVFDAALAFLPCHRIDRRGQVYLQNAGALRVTSPMAASAHRRVLLADHDPLAATGGHPWLSVTDIDAVIAGGGADRDAIDAIRALGAQFLIAT